MTGQVPTRAGRVRRTLIGALCAVGGCLGAGSARGQDVIALRMSAAIEGAGPVKLGDIADLQGSQAEALAGVVVESSAASNGGWRDLTVADVRAALESH